MPNPPDNTIVWFEVPVRDMSKAMAFYGSVFGAELKLDTSGPNPMAVFPTATPGGASGHLYPGTPAKDGGGPTVHLVLPGSVEEAIERCTKAGGEVLGPVIDIPPGRFAYAKDPDGNSIGLFEPKAA